MVEVGLEDITLKAARRNGYGSLLQKNSDTTTTTKANNSSVNQGTAPQDMETKFNRASGVGGDVTKATPGAAAAPDIVVGEASHSRNKSDVRIVIGDADDVTSVASVAGSMSTEQQSADDEASCASRISLPVVSVCSFVLFRSCYRCSVTSSSSLKTHV